MIRDIISVFRRRAPQVELTLVPTAVQGREATAQIVRAIERADAQGFDALILARGGGSLEDLWCFNEEAVARAVAACRTPIVSAVGHETDVSIADFVADVRAPTPSAAAELLAPDSSNLRQRLESLQRRLVLRMQQQIAHHHLRIEGLARRLRHPGERLRQQAQRLDDLEMRLQRALDRQLSTRRERFARLETRLAAQHPGRALSLLRQRLDSLAARLPRAMQEGLKERRLQLQSQVQTLNVVSPLATLGRATASCSTSAARPSATPPRPAPASASRPGWVRASSTCGSKTTTSPRSPSPCWIDRCACCSPCSSPSPSPPRPKASSAAC